MFRIKAVDILINEMKQFNEKYGVTHFSLVHDMFTANKEHLLYFCQKFGVTEAPVNDFIWIG